ncbi:MAG TPA: hypothetical protein VF297_14720 [Pyrinomonadaceae bacterium]
MKRLSVTFGQDTAALTRLTVRLLAAGRRVKQPAAQADEGECGAGARLLTLREAVALRNRLKKEWDGLSGEAILDALSCLRVDDEADFTEIDLETQSELWLLKALACEKCPRIDRGEVEKIYNRCLGGQFRIVLVLNNLAVLQAQNQKCEESLALFKKAIELSLKGGDLKAPFYNCALVFDHLRRQGTIRPHLGKLGKIFNLTQPPGSQAAPEEDPSEDAAIPEYWTRAQVRGACRQIALFGRDRGDVKPSGQDVEPSDEKDFYYSKARRIVPQLDLMGSFGDLRDGYDRDAADGLEDEAKQAQKGKDFDRSIEMFEMVSDFDPARRPVIDVEIKKTAEHWRQSANETIVKLTRDKKPAEALEQLSLLRANPLLADKKDEELMAKLLRQKHKAAEREADLLADADRNEEAAVKYKQLLGEEIDPHLRRQVSMKLANLLK